MSGTSLDGIDGVLADFLPPGAPRTLAFHHSDFPPELRSELLALNQPGPDELDRAARAGIALARCYAAHVGELLNLAGVLPSQVSALGCHGQTVRHRPDRGYTLQLGNGAWLADRTGMAVVCDFRSADLAAGGQGAPLVPIFHDALFHHPEKRRAILNLGGIANLTLLIPGQPVRGFDTGPGNMLLDAWIARHRGQPFDEGGAWAAQGRVDGNLLDELRRHPFLTLPPPKSTGRDDFHLDWLLSRERLPGLDPRDVQATLLELTVVSIGEALEREGKSPDELILCGGGVFNRQLVARLQERLGNVPVVSSAVYGVDPQSVEALAFAWLARERLAKRPANSPNVTGARYPSILGALYEPPGSQ